MAKKQIRKTSVPEPRKTSKNGEVGFDINYKNYEKLASFMNDRAKIQGRKRTGLTAKNQKKIAQEIKRARHLGLLPFTSKV